MSEVMILTPVTFCLILAGGVIGFVGFVVSLICVAMIAGFTRSTHSVQYLPVEQPDVEKLFGPSEEIAQENEEILLSKVGRKKKFEPTVVSPLDSPLEEISQSDINF